MAAAGITSPTWFYEPLPTQRRFHRDLRTRFKGYSGPIGSGKTKALCYEALFLAQLNQGCVGLIGAPTYPMLRDVTQTTMFSVLEEEGIGFSWLKSESVLTLGRSGSRILFRALDKFERIRGTNLAWFGIDELTYCKREAWARLEGRIRDPRAARVCGFAVWTPKGFDWVYKQFVSAQPGSDFKAYLGTARENTYLPAGFYDSLAGSYDERFYKQEVLGEYLNVFAGQAYYAFDRHFSVAPVKYHRDLPLRWSLDFNINPMCSVICQIDDHTAERGNYRREASINVLDEIYLRGGNTLDACEEFVSRVEPWMRHGQQVHVYIYGDATGSARQRSGMGSPSDWQAVREFFRSRSEFLVTYRYKPSNPLQKDRVAAVNAMLCNSEGTRRTIVDPKCEHLIEDFEQVSWKPGTVLLDQETNKMLTHISDAFGYFADTEFGITQNGGPRSKYVA